MGAELFLVFVFTVLDFFLGFVPGVICMVFCRFVAWFLRKKTYDFPWHLLHFGALVFILRGFCHVLLFVST